MTDAKMSQLADLIRESRRVREKLERYEEIVERYQQRQERALNRWARLDAEIGRLAVEELGVRPTGGDWQENDTRPGGIRVDVGGAAHVLIPHVSMDPATSYGTTLVRLGGTVSID